MRDENLVDCLHASLMGASKGKPRFGKKTGMFELIGCDFRNKTLAGGDKFLALFLSFNVDAYLVESWRQFDSSSGSGVQE